MKMDNSLMDEILASNPSPSTVRVILGKFMENGSYTRVIQEGTKALHAVPDDIGMMLFLSRAYAKSGFLGQAEDMLSKACSQIDSLATAYKDLAKLYVRQGRTSQAMEAIKKFLAHYPDDAEALELLKQCQPSRAVERTEETPENMPPTPPEEAEPVMASDAADLQELATPTLAEIYFSQGQLEDAIQIYESILARHPDDCQAAQRLKEIRAMVQKQKEEIPPHGEMTPVDELVMRKENIIAVLSTWLGKIQEMKGAL